MWQHWINFILSVILLILAYTGIGTGTLAVMAILILAFSLWGALATSDSTSTNRRAAHT